jgi:hypothetical protein
MKRDIKIYEERTFIKKQRLGHLSGKDMKIARY